MRRLAAVAAALLAAGPASAIEFEKAAAAPAPQACPGKPGFVRVPGGDACVRVSGRVTAGADVRTGRDGTAMSPTAAGRFAIDNRVDTDLGEVRTYVRVGNGRR